MEAIEYAKFLDSFYYKVPEIEEGQNNKLLVFSNNSNVIAPEIFSEFKEDQSNAGYNSSEIKSPISESFIRVFWPDEPNDVEFLQKWVQEIVDILNKNKYVTLVYDAENGCMQFGDVFDINVDYYNWKSDFCKIPKIKTNDSIIISFYKHKNNYSRDSKPIDTMKQAFFIFQINQILMNSKIIFVQQDGMDLIQ